MIEHWATRGLPADVLTRKAGQGLGRLGQFLAADPAYMASVTGVEAAKCFSYDSVLEVAQKNLCKEIAGLNSWAKLYSAFLSIIGASVYTSIQHNQEAIAPALIVGMIAMFCMPFVSKSITSSSFSRSDLINTISLFPQNPQELLETVENNPTILERFILSFEREENTAIQKWEAALEKARAGQTSLTTTTSGEAHEARIQKLGQLVQKLQDKIDAAKALLANLLPRMRTEAGILHAQRAIADAAIRIPDTEASLGSVLTDLVDYDSAMDELRELTGNGAG